MTSNEIVIYENKNKQIEVYLKEESVWLTLNQIANLYDVQKSAISKHIKNIYPTEELA